MSPQPIYLDEKSDQQTPLPVHTNPEPTPAVPDRSRCKRKRFRFLTVILLIWLGSRLYTYYSRFHRGRYEIVGGVENTLAITHGSIPPDVTLEECADWAPGDGNLKGRHFRFPLRGSFTSSANFKLPIASDKLFMLARGMASGSVKVRYGSGSDDVKVAVEARYRYREAIESVKVCTVKGGEGENGLGIFGTNWSRDNNVQFNVAFYLPEAEMGSILHVKSFETDAPFFSHDIGDLQGSVHFDAFKLRSMHTPIFVKSLGAKDAVLETSNTPITGDFNVSSSLQLITSNAHVDVNVNLFNDDEGAITDLLIGTSNAGIKGALQLESAKETGGKYQVSASTSNSALDLVFSEGPVRSALVLAARTYLGPARVQLYNAYEGTFDVGTSLLRPEITWLGDAKDPEGKGRKRRVNVINRGNSRVYGSTSWSDDEKLLGSVSIETSLAPLTLRL